MDIILRNPSYELLYIHIYFFKVWRSWVQILRIKLNNSEKYCQKKYHTSMNKNVAINVVYSFIFTTSKQWRKILRVQSFSFCSFNFIFRHITPNKNYKVWVFSLKSVLNYVEGNTFLMCEQLFWRSMFFFFSYKN